MTSMVGRQKDERQRRRNDVKGPLDELLTPGERQGPQLNQRQTILVDHVDSARFRGKVDRAIDDDAHALEHLVAFVQLTARNRAIQKNDAIEVFAIDHFGQLRGRSQDRHGKRQALRGVALGNDQAFDYVGHVGRVHEGDQAARMGTVSQQRRPDG